jgi:hypothetical protein
MLIHDDVFSWKGFGGVLELASGQCRLRIFDLGKPGSGKVTPLKPKVVVVSDLPQNGRSLKKLSVRSCAGHIATCVARDFKIDPHRMLYLEFQPASTYGRQGEHHIAAKLDVVDFQWLDGRAMHPKWRPLGQPLLDEVMDLVQQTQ